MVAARWPAFTIRSNACCFSALSGVSHPELGGVDDRGQDVVELVGDAGGQFADAAQPLGLEQLLPEGFRLVHRSQHLLAGHGLASDSPRREGSTPRRERYRPEK